MKLREQEFHIAVETMLCSIIDARRCWWCHIPNEGVRSQAALAILCRMGLKPGAPDYVIVVEVPGEWARAFFIELKFDDGVLSDNQIRCHTALNRIGGKVYICRSIDEVLRALTIERVPTRIVGGIEAVQRKIA